MHHSCCGVFVVGRPHPTRERELGLSDGALGTALLGAPFGASLATTLCVRVLPRWGSHRLAPATVVGYAVTGHILGMARSEPGLFLALVGVGFFLGGLDVAINVQAAARDTEPDRRRVRSTGQLYFGHVISLAYVKGPDMYWPIEGVEVYSGYVALVARMVDVCCNSMRSLIACLL
jgi:MFS family permease